MPAATFKESAARAESSHDRILRSAKQLFASRGYENTSTVAIARMAGTSESQLMKHFGSKEGLLTAIFDQGWERMRSEYTQIDGLASPEQKLHALLETTIACLERDPELKQVLLLEGRRFRKEGLMVQVTGGFREFVRSLDGILEEMRAAGQLRKDLHTQAVRSALIGIFEGSMRDQLLARRADFPAHFSSADVRQIFDVFLPALRG